MSLGRPLDDFSKEFNSLYKITLDMSGWDKTAVQIVAPTGGALVVYGSNDGDAVTGSQLGSAELAINFTPIQATNLATGVATNSLSGAGLWSIPINGQFLRLQGTPAAAGTNVYKLLLFNSKVS